MEYGTREHHKTKVNQQQFCGTKKNPFKRLSKES